MRITVRSDGSVTLTRPTHAPSASVEKFLREKIAWITSKLKYFSLHPVAVRTRKRSIYTSAHYRTHRAEALALVSARLEHFNQHYQFSYNTVSVKNQKTRWGSCSSKRNLNFNYKVLFLTPAQCDYIIVHELCHLVEFNHSTRFWARVAEQIPDYKAIRKTVRKFSL